MRYVNRQLNQILESVYDKFDPDEALPDEDKFGEELFVLVRSGGGIINRHTSGHTEFTDETDRIWVVPTFHDPEMIDGELRRGWQSIAYDDRNYQLFGGIRTPFWINLQNPIDL